MVIESKTSILNYIQMMPLIYDDWQIMNNLINYLVIKLFDDNYLQENLLP